MALDGVVSSRILTRDLCGVGVHQATHLKLWPVVALGNSTFTAPLQTEISTRKSVNFGIKSSSPRASVISIPELFTYALYCVTAFVLKVIYLAII